VNTCEFVLSVPVGTLKETTEIIFISAIFIAATGVEREAGRLDEKNRPHKVHPPT